MPVTGDFRELDLLRRRLRRLGDEGAKRVRRQVAEEVKLLVAEGFQRGVSPSGQAWAPLVARSGQPLRDTGRLASSITVTGSGLFFVVGTNVAYADVHQHGATVRAKTARSLYSKKIRAFFGKQVTIPARPFLPEGSLPAPWGARVNGAAAEALEIFFG